MDSLVWETALTALLLIGAYFLGAFCGCVLRRLFFPGTLPAQSEAGSAAGLEGGQQSSVTQHAATAASAGGRMAADDAGRFERALTGAGGGVRTDEATNVGHSLARQTETIEPGLAQTEPQPPPTSQPQQMAAPAPASASVQLPHRREDPLPPRETVGDVANRHAKTWSTTTLAITDDLQNIEGIDAETAERLKQSGIGKYSDIAKWTAADVERISASLGLGDRISRDNWIEQAALLSSGKRTAFAARRASEDAMATSAPTEDSGVPRNIPRELGGNVAAPTQREADPEPVVYPAYSGTSESSSVAAQIQRIDLGSSKAAGATASPASRNSTAAAAAAAAAAGVVAAVARQGSPEQASRDGAVGGRDDLSAIEGVTPEIVRVLNAHGVTRLIQIAEWKSSDLQRFDGLVGKDRIVREDWVGQARRLAGLAPVSEAGAGNPASAVSGKPGTAASAAAAAAARVSQSSRPQPVRQDLLAMRSVRAAALVGADASDRASEIDDLKRIRGIGVLIERKLRQLGINTYEEIAGWTAEDVKRVSQHLNFDGKIERENWIEQARILASGGQTEYARRLESGEV